MRELSDDEIIAVRKATPSNYSRPWGDTLAFARAILAAAQAAMPPREPTLAHARRGSRQFPPHRDPGRVSLPMKGNDDNKSDGTHARRMAGEGGQEGTGCGPDVNRTGLGGSSTGEREQGLLHSRAPEDRGGGNDALVAAQAAMPPREPTPAMEDAGLAYWEGRAGNRIVSINGIWQAMHDAWTNEQTSGSSNADRNESGTTRGGAAPAMQIAHVEPVARSPLDPTADLVRSLRECDTGCICIGPCAHAALLEEAADALEQSLERIKELAVTAQREVDNALRAEAERDALREVVRELVACDDESNNLAAARLYGKPHTPEYKARELDYRQRKIEAWRAARAKVPK